MNMDEGEFFMWLVLLMVGALVLCAWLDWRELRQEKRRAGGGGEGPA